MSNDFDQVIKRVYYKHLEIDSPFNTYQNAGLPPGPIFMADINAIDAVLNPAQHDFIYFCADPSRPGYHIFEKTYEAHMINAKKYAEWVNKLGIKL